MTQPPTRPSPGPAAPAAPAVAPAPDAPLPASLAGRVVHLVKEAVSAWIDDYAPSMGAALAYYTLSSIAPLLLIVIAVAGLVLDAEVARGQILEQLRGLMGEEGARAVEDLLRSASKPSHGIVGTVVGAVVLALGATTVFAELQSALDRIWRAPAREATSSLWFLLRTRLLSFGLVLTLGFLLLVSLVVSAALAAYGRWAIPESWEIVGQLLNVAASFALTTVAFALIYRYMPRVRIHWPDVWVGALLTSLLFSVGKLLIGLYIGKSGIVSGFGAAGSVVVMLIWVYYSAQVFLLGAELTWVYAHLFGSRRGQPRPGAKPRVQDAAAPGRRFEVNGRQE